MEIASLDYDLSCTNGMTRKFEWGIGKRKVSQLRAREPMHLAVAAKCFFIFSLSWPLGKRHEIFDSTAVSNPDWLDSYVLKVPQN